LIFGEHERLTLDLGLGMADAITTALRRAAASHAAPRE